ncbi:hypothetical protein ACFPN2_14820 [Steroidobacter flavus]|uniref:Uncharacterized protein n=1 Tax=Steroidobacter flavus TaxID=1842136 RepID=A0ABV8SRX4_9GAMM
MSKVVFISVASAAAFGLLSLHLVKQLKAGEATIADLQAQVATLKEQQQQPPPREAKPPAEDIGPQPTEAIGTPPKEPQKLVGVLTSPNQAGPSGMPNRDERMRMFREQRERQRQLMQDPEYRAAMRVQTRANFARQYPGVVQELDLDSQQADAFFDLLAEQQLRANDQMQGLWEMEGVDPNDQAAMQERSRKIQQAAQENQRRNEAEITAHLGAKAQAWKEYQSTMGVRYELENMRNTLSANGLPINEEMSKPMLKAMAQASQADMQENNSFVNLIGGPQALATRPGVNPGGSDNMERHLEIAKKRNQRMLDAISPYLSFEQRAAIEKQQEAQMKMQEAQLRLMRAQSKSENNGVYFLESSGVTVAQP